MDATTRPAAGPPRTRTHWLPLAACSAGSFVLLAYTTVVTVSLPAIGRDLGSGYRTSQWVIDAYTLGIAMLLMAMGAWGDRVGHRALFVRGMAGFTLATLACAVATNGGWLVAARALQGVAGAAVLASVVPLLALGYDGRDRGRAFAAWGGVSAAGSTLGTVAGGVVTEYVSWRWLFVAPLVVCLAACWLGRVSLPRQQGRAAPVDWAGTVAISAATGGLTYAAIEAGEIHGAPTGVVAGLLVAGIGGAAFARAERRALAPILPATALSAGFRAVLVVAFGYYFAAFGFLPALSTWLQTAQGRSAGGVALLLCIQMVAYVTVTAGPGHRLHAAPTWLVLGGGSVLTGLAGLLGALAWSLPALPVLAGVLVVSGLGAGVVSPVLPAVAATLVPREYSGTAGAAASAARQLGLAVGVAACGALGHRYGASNAGVAVPLLACGVLGVGAGLWLTGVLRRERGG